MAQAVLGPSMNDSTTERLGGDATVADDHSVCLGGLTPQEFALEDATIAAILAPGPRHPVMFLHGNSSCKEVWVHQIAALRKRGHAIAAPDLPGHGRSTNAKNAVSTYSFPGYASVVSHLLDAIGWPTVDVVGWSLGGHIGLQWLATDKRVRSLTIVGTPPACPGRAALQDAFHVSSSMDLTGKPHFTAVEACTYAASTLGGANWVSPHLLENVRRTHGLARQEMYSNAVRGEGIDQRRLVETDPRPLCVFHGAGDPFVRLDYLISLQYRNLWANQVHVIADAGHAPHWQYPEAFNAVLCAFLSDCVAQTD